MVHHLLAGRGVQVAGGLVGKEQARPVDEGAGDRDSLLLAAGELAGVVPQPVSEAHRGQLRPGPVEGVGLARELAGRGHVLESGHGGDEMEGLEDDPDVAAPKPRERVLVQGGQVMSGRRDLPAGGAFKAADDHEQGGLARARGSDHAHRLPGCQVEVDAAQDLHRSGRPGQRDAQTAQRYDGRVGGVPGYAVRTIIPAVAGMTVVGEIRHGGRFPGVQADVRTVLGHACGGKIQTIRWVAG